MRTFIVLAAVLCATPAIAEEATQPPEKKVTEKKICKVNPALTGSRMSKKLCKTASEWAEVDQGKSAADIKTISRSR